MALVMREPFDWVRVHAMVRSGSIPSITWVWKIENLSDTRSGQGVLGYNFLEIGPHFTSPQNLPKRLLTPGGSGPRFRALRREILLTPILPESGAHDPGLGLRSSGKTAADKISLSGCFAFRERTRS